MQSDYKVIGTMSGTSLDGLDIVLCNFNLTNDKWQFTIEKAQTYPYSSQWINKLSSADHLNGLELMQLHNEFGSYTGTLINTFIGENKKDIDFIASHGHTIFHQPDIGLTLQIGNGAHIAATTVTTTICDFRSLDVALNGQGAPLVPIGDKLLFSDFDGCLNLGGFANISFDSNNVRVAYDVCPVNIVINHLVKSRGLELDTDGKIAKKGTIQPSLLNEMNELEFYTAKGPKSLGKEWVLKYLIPLLDKYPYNLEDKLRTFYEHVTIQLINTFKIANIKNILITGGGAYNKFLIQLLKENTTIKIIVPDKQIIEFKEALVFAFLGVLRMRGEINCLQSVTGAKFENCGGIIFKV